MGSLISTLAEKARCNDTSSRGTGRRRRYRRSRSEKRNRSSSRARDSVLDILILAAAELIKIEIDNAKIRRAQARRQGTHTAQIAGGNPYDGVLNVDDAEQPPPRRPGKRFAGPRNNDIPSDDRDTNIYSDSSVRGERKAGSYIRRNPDRKRDRRGNSRKPERWSPLGQERPGEFHSPPAPPQMFEPPGMAPGMGGEKGDNHPWQQHQEQGNMQGRNPYEKPLS